ncbi:hypothetical protein ABZ464_03620 [Streptomyces sp. NPDC005820]|uniref:hypothetical protein n=1 Tax=Streptomyces sp. NPDC005820 TaxID=3157069 RepID=UPI0034079958
MKRPSRTNPGLHISAPSADERAPGYGQSPSLLELSGKVPTELAGQPSASYACHCGQTGEATGRRAVQALVTEYGTHGRACPDDNGRPWERHGQPLPPRSNGSR